MTKGGVVGHEQRQYRAALTISTAKRRLRQIDGRIRFLTKRIDAAEVVDPERPSQGRLRRGHCFERPSAMPIPRERSE